MECDHDKYEKAYGFLTIDSGWQSRIRYCTVCSRIEHVGTSVQLDREVVKARAEEHSLIVLKGGD